MTLTKLPLDFLWNVSQLVSLCLKFSKITHFYVLHYTSIQDVLTKASSQTRGCKRKRRWDHYVFVVVSADRSIIRLPVCKIGAPRLDTSAFYKQIQAGENYCTAFSKSMQSRPVTSFSLLISLYYARCYYAWSFEVQNCRQGVWLALSMCTQLCTPSDKASTVLSVYTCQHLWTCSHCLQGVCTSVGTLRLQQTTGYS